MPNRFVLHPSLPSPLRLDLLLNRFLASLQPHIQLSVEGHQVLAGQGVGQRVETVRVVPDRKYCPTIPYTFLTSCGSRSRAVGTYCNIILYFINAFPLVSFSVAWDEILKTHKLTDDNVFHELSYIA